MLSWLNVSGLVRNNQTFYFYFNATAATPGNYNITVLTANATGINVTNISITINDTTVPTNITFTGLSPANNSYINTSSIAFNATSVDNGVLGALIIRIRNSSTSPVNSSVSVTSPLFVNFTNLVDGVYFVNVTANDTFNNANSTQTRTYTVDTTRPLLTYAGGTNESNINASRSFIFINATYTETNFLNITFYLYNATSLVNQTTFNSSDAITQLNITSLPNGNYTYNITVYDLAGNKNDTASRTIILDTTAPTGSLSCTPNSVDRADTVTCTCSGTDERSGVASTSTTANPSTVETGTHQTSCTITDFAGNTGSATTTFEVNGGGGNGGSGGSSTSAPATSWSRTDDQSAVAFAGTASSAGTPLTSNLGSKERVKLMFAGTAHTVGVLSLTTTSAVVQVASTPQNATLLTRSSKSFDVTGDGVMDLSVLLQSITNGKATLVITPLAQPTVQAPPVAPAADGPSESDTEKDTDSTSSSSLVWWIVGIVLVLALVGYFVRKQHYL